MSQPNIHTFCTYHKELGLDWGKVIIALTFADIVPYIHSNKPPDEVYCTKLEEWDNHIREVLRSNVKVNEEVVKTVRIVPVTDKYDKCLPNKAYWFTPLCLSVLEILDARPKMHSENFHLSGVSPPTEEEIRVVEGPGRSLDQPPSYDQEPVSEQPDESVEDHERPSIAFRRIQDDNPERSYWQTFVNILNRGVRELLSIRGVTAMSAAMSLFLWALHKKM